MNKFAVSAAMAVGIYADYADNHWTSVKFEGFEGEIDDYGNWEFFVKGLQGSKLETSGNSVTMLT